MAQVSLAGRTGAFEHAGGMLFALLLFALVVVPATGAPAGSPVPTRRRHGAHRGARKRSRPTCSPLRTTASCCRTSRTRTSWSRSRRSGHYAKGGQHDRALGTPPVDLVEVYVRTDPGTGAAALRPFVHQVSDEDASAGLVAAWVAPGRILALAEVPSVREVRPVLRPRVRTGSVTTAGDALLRAAELRNATGLSGAGIRVGVISDGVDHWSSARATGDLPADLAVLRNDVGGDEGTAMLEIVHDIAPNASLVFHDCGWNVLEFNRAIDALADAGCRVIVDDIGWTRRAVLRGRRRRRPRRGGGEHPRCSLRLCGRKRRGPSLPGPLPGRRSGAGTTSRSGRPLLAQPALRGPAARGLGHGSSPVVRAVRAGGLELRPRALQHRGPARSRLRPHRGSRTGTTTRSRC